MDDLDKKIERALHSATDNIKITDSESVIEDVLTTFQGRYRFIAISAGLKAVVAFGLMIFSVYMFFQQETVMAMIAYATLAIVCTLTICVIYIFFWITLNKNLTNKEVKRLELQIALLVNKLDAAPIAAPQGNPTTNN